MDDAVGTKLGEGVLYRPAIADVHLKEPVIPRAIDRFRRGARSRIGKLVDCENLGANLEHQDVERRPNQ